MEQSMSGYGSSVAQLESGKSTFEKITEKISDGLSGLALRVEQESEKLGETQSGVLASVAPEIQKYGELTASALETSAQYVRDLDIDEIKDKTKVSIQRNPGRAILIAAGAGFLLGALLKRRGV